MDAIWRYPRTLELIWYLHHLNIWDTLVTVFGFLPSLLTFQGLCQSIIIFNIALTASLENIYCLLTRETPGVVVSTPLSIFGREFLARKNYTAAPLVAGPKDKRQLLAHISPWSGNFSRFYRCSNLETLYSKTRAKSPIFAVFATLELNISTVGEDITF